VTPELRSRLRTELIGHEGLVTRAYDDATGRVIQPGTTVRGWVTVGYGRNLIGKGLTVRESDYLLSNDIADVERELDQHLAEWRTWAPARQLAIANITYNLGVVPFVTKWPNTVADLRAGRFATAGGRLRQSLWRKQVGDGRALPLIRMIETGVLT
jgi:GH24 family phage-related lysozyme (muramidase)